MAQFVSVWRGE